MQFDKPLGAFQALAHYMADASTRIDGGRVLVHEAAWNHAQGRSIARFGPMAKLFCCETYRETTRVCAQIWGGVAFTIEYDQQMFFRRAKALQLSWWDSPYLEELIAAGARFVCGSACSARHTRQWEQHCEHIPTSTPSTSSAPDLSTRTRTRTTSTCVSTGRCGASRITVWSWSRGTRKPSRCTTTPRRFSNCNAVAGPFAEWPVPLEGDDISEIIEKYRDRLPFSDQLPTFDPPKHTAHRALLARLITPKRLKENEEFMWRLADRQIDEFLGRGRVRVHPRLRAPLHPPGHRRPARRSRRRARDVPRGAPGRPPRSRPRVRDGKVSHKPLEFLYERFTTYIEERRREPRDDVMTGLATATFPDGSLPEVRDVMLIASNLFAAGQETTARLLGVMLQLIGERPELQQLLRDERDRIPNFIEECLRLETPLQSTLPIVAGRHEDRRRRRSRRAPP